MFYVVYTLIGQELFIYAYYTIHVITYRASHEHHGPHTGKPNSDEMSLYFLKNYQLSCMNYPKVYPTLYMYILLYAAILNNHI